MPRFRRTGGQLATTVQPDESPTSCPRDAAKVTVRSGRRTIATGDSDPRIAAGEDRGADLRFDLLSIANPDSGRVVTASHLSTGDAVSSPSSRAVEGHVVRRREVSPSARGERPTTRSLGEARVLRAASAGHRLESHRDDQFGRGTGRCRCRHPVLLPSPSQRARSVLTPVRLKRARRSVPR
jgi:hypothetical protein